jgi:hypothetical protein
MGATLSIRRLVPALVLATALALAALPVGAAAAHKKKRHHAGTGSPSATNTMTFSGQLSATMTTGEWADSTCDFGGPLWEWSTQGTSPNADLFWQLWVNGAEPGAAYKFPTSTYKYPGGPDAIAIDYVNETNPAQAIDYEWTTVQDATGTVSLTWSSDDGKRPADDVTATRLVIKADLTLQPQPAADYSEQGNSGANPATAPETIRGTWTCNGPAR